MKYYVYETAPAMVTFVREIEDIHGAENALENAIASGDGNLVGVVIGDYLDGYSPEYEILRAEKYNLPGMMYVPEKEQE